MWNKNFFFTIIFSLHYISPTKYTSKFSENIINKKKLWQFIIYKKTRFCLKLGLKSQKMTHTWNSKNKNWHYYICLKLPRGFFIFYFTPQKRFGKYNGTNSLKFWFWKTIAKNRQNLLMFALFRNFWMRLGVAGRDWSAENSVEGCLCSHKISVQSTTSILIVQKLTELFNKTLPLKHPF